MSWSPLQRLEAHEKAVPDPQPPIVASRHAGPYLTLSTEVALGCSGGAWRSLGRTNGGHKQQSRRRVLFREHLGAEHSGK